MERMKYNPPVFPFAAIVGQELLKLGLILNAINPQLGGMLIRGEKEPPNQQRQGHCPDFSPFFMLFMIAPITEIIQISRPCALHEDPEKTPVKRSPSKKPLYRLSIFPSTQQRTAW
jgi:hypothetical protein